MTHPSAYVLPASEKNGLRTASFPYRSYTSDCPTNENLAEQVHIDQPIDQKLATLVALFTTAGEQMASSQVWRR